FATCITCVVYPRLFFFIASAPSEIYTLSLHDALPISGSQLLTGRVPQRDGILCLACSNTHLRCSSSTASSPLWRCSGVTKRSLLCRCSVLYQRTNRSTHRRASSSEVKPREGH